MPRKSEQILRELAVSTEGRSDTELLVHLWREVLQVTTFKSGFIGPVSDRCTAGCKLHSATVVQEVTDLDSNTKTSWQTTYTISNACPDDPTGRQRQSVVAHPSVPVDAKALGYTSPSGRFRVSFASNGGSDDVVITVMDASRLMKKFVVAKVHGALFPSPFYQNVSWSEDETKIVYVAEQAVSPTAKVWETAKGTAVATVRDAAGSGRSSAFEAKMNFGETLREFSRLSIFWCDLTAGKVVDLVALSRPSSDSVDATDGLESAWWVNPVFVTDAEVWAVATPYFPQQMGLAMCATRANQLVSLRVPSMFPASPGGPLAAGAPFSPTSASSPAVRRSIVSLPSEVTCVRNLRRLRHGGTLICYAPPPGCKTHSATYSMWSIDAGSRQFRCVVPIVEEPREGDGFPGFYSATGSDIFPMNSGNQTERNVSGDIDARVLVQSPRRSGCVVYEVDTNTGSIRLPSFCSSTPGTWNILSDVRDGGVLLCHSAGTIPPALYWWDCSSNGDNLIAVDTAQRDLWQKRLCNVGLTTSIVPILPVSEHHDTEALFHHFAAVGGDSAPCRGDSDATILFVHGGPHSSDSNAFQHSVFFQLLCGFQVVSVNYGGSPGFGSRRIHELLGHIGRQDVDDCIAALAFLAPYVDPSRVVVSGGSHGGFLAAHLSSQFPDRFQVALLRNPVINIASMYWETDIPDWCLAETGVRDADVAAFYEASPIGLAHKVTAATLIGVGLEDLRVPPPQGRAWFHALRWAQHTREVAQRHDTGEAQPSGGAAGTARRNVVRLLEYPQTGHAMDSPHAAADFHVQAVMLIREVLPQTV